ncbi:MAG: ThiF family adenylyltransferase [Lachnospiraceae bacterium]|nr:ThiF family adenylyltransferase [Lachnospiraceae bacterium]
MSLFDELAIEAETSTADQPRTDFESIREAYYTAIRDKAIALTSDHNFDLNEADIRFSTALNLRKVRNALVAIIGAGGLGNWQWRILAAMGFKRIAIYDDDVVGIENVGPQAHSVFDIGMPKVEAVQKAAMQYRGIEIIARNMRVNTLLEIESDLSEVPDIIIGCTDSAEFRNAMIASLKNFLFCDFDRARYLPQLFLDYRMSLGDWTAYVIPVRKMFHYRLEVSSNEVERWFDSYTNEAVFLPEEAVQEPCTERAIAYTGANVASFTGAVLHWYFSGGSTSLGSTEGMHKFFNCDGNMGWRCSFSSRDFEFISDTSKERKLRDKLSEIRRKFDSISLSIVRAYSLDLVVPDPEIGWYCDRCINNGSGFYAMVCDDNAGDLIMFSKSDEMYMLGLDGTLYKAVVIEDGDYSKLIVTERMNIERVSCSRMMYYARSRRSTGFSIMLRKPEGTLFKKNFEGNENETVWYRMRRSLDDHVLIDVCIETHNCDNSEVFTRTVQSFDLSEYEGGYGYIYTLSRAYDLEECTNVDITTRMDAFAVRGEQLESTEQEAESTTYEPVTVAGLTEGMVITTSNEYGAEELTVTSVNPLTVRNDDGEVYRVGKRSYRHLYKVVRAESSAAATLQNEYTQNVRHQVETVAAAMGELGSSISFTATDVMEPPSCAS